MDVPELYDRAEVLFLKDIVANVKRVVAAATFLEQALIAASQRTQTARSRKTVTPVDQVFYHIHAMLHNAAAISMILWPEGRSTGYEWRGRHLRKLLGVPDDYSLKFRTVRHDIVHRDERIHAWSAASQNGNSALQMIGPRRTTSWFDPKDVFEHYIPDEKVLLSLGKEIDLQATYDEVISIGEKVFSVLDQRHP